MKKQMKPLVSALLVLCMLLGLNVVGFASDAPVALDYDAAQDGDLLYTVDFARDDGVTQPRYDRTNATPVISEDGHTVRFENKAAGDMIYTMKLPQYPITDHVYTLSYHLDTTSDKIRAGVGFLYDGGAGTNNLSQVTCFSLVYVDGGNTVQDDALSLNYGTMTGYRVEPLVERYTEQVGDASRSYYKVVVDGVRMVALLYVMDTDREYRLQAGYAIHSEAENFEDYLTPSFSNYDAISGSDYVALGGYTVEKGSFAESSFSSDLAKLRNGDVLYTVDFTDNGTYGWEAQNATVESADTLKLGAVDNKELSIKSRVLPYGEQFMLEDHTMEMYVDSNYANGTNGRIGLHVLNVGNHTIGFLLTEDTSNADRMFAYDGNFVAANDTKLTSFAQWNYRLIPTVYQKLSEFSLDTSDPTKPNVKLEFSAKDHTVTLWELSRDSGEFEKISALTYDTGSVFYQCLRIRTWGTATTDITVRNLQIKKGLTAVGFNGSTTALCGIQSTDTVNDAASVRFIAVVDSLAYSKVGFEVNAVWKDAEGNVHTGSPLDLSTNQVFTSIADKNGNVTTAEDCGGSYLFALRVDNVPMGEGIQVDFIITPYTADAETGEKSRGETLTVSFVNGIYQPEAAPLEA